jgi:hypothetical protein
MGIISLKVKPWATKIAPKLHDALVNWSEHQYVMKSQFLQIRWAGGTGSRSVVKVSMLQAHMGGSCTSVGP